MMHGFTMTLKNEIVKIAPRARVNSVYLYEKLPLRKTLQTRSSSCSRTPYLDTFQVRL